MVRAMRVVNPFPRQHGRDRPDGLTPELPGRGRVPRSHLHPTQGLRRIRQAEDQVVQATVQAWSR